jgi:hypothetical protein
MPGHVRLVQLGEGSGLSPVAGDLQQPSGWNRMAQANQKTCGLTGTASK